MVNVSAVVGSHVAIGSFRGRGNDASRPEAGLERGPSRSELFALNEALLRQAIGSDPTNVESLLRNWEPKGTASRDWDPLALEAVTYFDQCLSDVGLGKNQAMNQEMIDVVDKIARTGNHAAPLTQGCQKLLAHLESVNGAMKTDDFTRIRTAFADLRLCAVTLSQVITPILNAPENKRRDADLGPRS